MWKKWNKSICHDNTCPCLPRGVFLPIQFQNLSHLIWKQNFKYVYVSVYFLLLKICKQLKNSSRSHSYSECCTKCLINGPWLRQLAHSKVVHQSGEDKGHVFLSFRECIGQNSHKAVSKVCTSNCTSLNANLVEITDIKLRENLWSNLKCQEMFLGRWCKEKILIS